MKEWDKLDFWYDGFFYENTWTTTQSIHRLDASRLLIVGGWAGTSKHTISIFNQNTLERTIFISGSDLDNELESIVTNSIMTGLRYLGLNYVWVTLENSYIYIHVNYEVEIDDIGIVLWGSSASNNSSYLASATFKLDFNDNLTLVFETFTDGYYNVFTTWDNDPIESREGTVVFLGSYAYVDGGYGNTRAQTNFVYKLDPIVLGQYFAFEDVIIAAIYNYFPSANFATIPYPSYYLGRVFGIWTKLGITSDLIEFTDTIYEFIESDVPVMGVIPKVQEEPYLPYYELFGFVGDRTDDNLYAATAGVQSENKNYIKKIRMSGNNNSITEDLTLETLWKDTLTEKSITHSAEPEYMAWRGSNSTYNRNFAVSGEKIYDPFKMRYIKIDDYFAYKPWTNYNYTGFPTYADEGLWEDSELITNFPAFSWEGIGFSYTEGNILDIGLYKTTYPDLVDEAATFLNKYYYTGEIEKIDLSTTYQLEQSISLSGKLYIKHGNYIYKIEYIPNYHIKPTSITTDYDTIHIGGQLIKDYTTVSGIYLGSGVATFRNPMYVNALMPAVTMISGDYSSVVSPMYRRIGYSGLAYVKRYNLYESFIHGNIIPFRAALAGRSSFYDISYNLPSGISTSSVAYATGSNFLMGTTGTIYEMLLSGELWSVYDTVSPISTSHLSFLGELFTAQTGGTHSIEKTPSVFMPVWEKADYNLPEGAIVLDLEEDFYADR